MVLFSLSLSPDSVEASFDLEQFKSLSTMIYEGTVHLLRKYPPNRRYVATTAVVRLCVCVCVLGSAHLSKGLLAY